MIGDSIHDAEAARGAGIPAVLVSWGYTAKPASELGADGSRLVGAAKYTVHNVAPRNGAVTIWLTIDWGSPLRTVVDYLVIQP